MNCGGYVSAAFWEYRYIVEGFLGNLCRIAKRKSVLGIDTAAPEYERVSVIFL